MREKQRIAWQGRLLLFYTHFTEGISWDSFEQEETTAREVRFLCGDPVNVDMLKPLIAKGETDNYV